MGRGWGEGEGTRLYFSAFSIQLPLNSLLPANKETTSNNNQNNSIVQHLSGSKNGGGGRGRRGGEWKWGRQPTENGAV